MVQSLSSIWMRQRKTQLRILRMLRMLRMLCVRDRKKRDEKKWAEGGQGLG